MSLAEKVQKMFNKYKYKFACAVAGMVFAMPNATHADFYDGVRRPNTAQVHYTANFAGETTSHNLALKYFGKHVFGIGALTTNTSELTGYFGGLGYLLETFERIKLLPVAGYAVLCWPIVRSQMIFPST